MRSLVLGLIVGALIGGSAHSQTWTGVNGRADSAGDASWIDFANLENFQSGDKLRIRLFGGMSCVLVRFVDLNCPYTQPCGIDGIAQVPASGVLEYSVSGSHPNVRQFSIHSGLNPFNVPLNCNSNTANKTPIMTQLSRAKNQ